MASARPARHHDDARFTRQLPVSFSRICCTGFIAAGEQIEVTVIVESIQKLQVAFTGHTEGCVASVNAQLVGQDLPSMAHIAGAFAVSGMGLGSWAAI